METSEKVIVGAVATIVGVSMLKGCASDRREQQWRNENIQSARMDPIGASLSSEQGGLNLNAVKDAFRSTQDMSVFETRVNEIFEGQNLVVFEAKEISGGFQVLAREDLDGSKSTTAGDDLLFTLEVKNRTASLEGAGVNSYYKESWIYEVPAEAQQQMAAQNVTHHEHSSFTSSPFFWWWVLSPGWGGYYTPMVRYDSIYHHRESYRRSSAYDRQRSQNRSYASSMNSKYGSSYRNARYNTTTQRKSYVRKTTSKASATKMAASTRKTSSSSKSQVRSSSSAKKSSFFGSSKKSSSSRSSRSYSSYRGSSGFGA